MVKISSPDRSLIFDDVEVRIGEGCDATMHVDTDESNAAGCTPATIGELIKNKTAKNHFRLTGTVLSRSLLYQKDVPASVRLFCFIRRCSC